jgi:hypothetical protein
MKPLCFVLMPFARKADPTGGKDIDFDRIYEAAIKPAIRDADMEPIRADQEKTGGIIHKSMYERLLLCDFAVADLTTANANVFYELGVRHAARPSTTLTIFATHQPVPFDVNFLRSLPYDLGQDNAFDESAAEALRTAIAGSLKTLRAQSVEGDVTDSPLFQLVSAWKPGELAHVKTDIFRDQIQYNQELKDRLAAIRVKAKSKESRPQAVQLLTEIRTDIGPLDAVEAGTAIDLMLTFRALGDWSGMIDVEASMPKVLQRQVLVQEQLAFALNRRAGQTDSESDRNRALEVLNSVLAEQGPSSETCGLIGRIHKDNWTSAQKNDDEFEAAGHLRKAIEAYVQGFMADQRDAYPGVNAVTLLEIEGSPKSLSLKQKLAPVVLFAVEQRLDKDSADYWDHATLLELAVISEQPDEAIEPLGDALSVVRESWEIGTTLNNLKMIEAARSARGDETDWLQKIISALVRKQDKMA